MSVSSPASAPVYTNEELTKFMLAMNERVDFLTLHRNYNNYNTVQMQKKMAQHDLDIAEMRNAKINIIRDCAIGGGKALFKLGTKEIVFQVAKKWTSIAAKELANETAKEIAIEGAKELATQAAKEIAIEGAKELSTQAAKEISIKSAKKLSTKTAEKIIPIVSLVAGVGLAVFRVYRGYQTGDKSQYPKAFMEVASGALACFPGYGTAASVCIDICLTAHDVKHALDRVEGEINNDPMTLETAYQSLSINSAKPEKTDVDTAYRNFIKILHPDKHTSLPKEQQEEYSILMKYITDCRDFIYKNRGWE